MAMIPENASPTGVAAAVGEGASAVQSAHRHLFQLAAERKTVRSR
jgi:hypothetical protein